MKVFVATDSGEERGDFSWTIPGELVHFPPLICDCPDCGCERAMCGFVSHRATSSFTVRDLDIDPATYAELMWDTLQAGGWVSDGSDGGRRWVEDWAGEHVDIASSFPVEAPLEFCRDRVMVRLSR